jgi:hypothetical protein
MSCRECYTGHERPGTPRGAEIEAHGLKVYVTDPLSKDHLSNAQIVVISDAFGWSTTNIRLLADAYADSTGCKVFVPDFMKGRSAFSVAMEQIFRVQR